MFFPLLSLSTIALSTGTAAAPAPDKALSRAVSAANTLQSWYNGATGIWDTCGWWNGANCMTTLANLAALDLDDGARDIAEGVFQNTFAVAPNVNPYPERSAAVKYTSKNGKAFDQQQGDEGKVPTGAANASLWLDGSYDDDAWWGLAWVAAYDVTGQRDYLDLAEGLFYHLSNSWPSKCGNGGIDSDSTHVYVGAIANELFLALAAGLANRADDSEYYLDWAKRQWAWFSDSGLINDRHTINDGLMDDCTNNGDTVWTYNQGVILGGLVELYRATGEDDASNSTYLDEAAKIAKGAIAELTDDDHVVREPCEPDDCGADQTQFKGAFIRNLRALHAVAPDDAYARVIKASAESLWRNDRIDGDKLGVDWSGPVDGDKVDASTHSSAMDALVAAIRA